MTFDYSCFVSYRHGQYDLAQRFIKDLENALSAEIELLDKRPVYVDKTRLAGGDFFNKALAEALCKSVCMIMVYTPRYFDRTETYCAREYKAMETLEKARFQAAEGLISKQHGLIIPVVFRGRDLLPHEIKHNRQYEDFTDFLLVSEEMSSHQSYAPKIRDIARYIFERCRELANMPDLFDACRDFDFPSDAEIAGWLEGVIPSELSFPVG
jgi:TIR domain